MTFVVELELELVDLWWNKRIVGKRLKTLHWSQER